MGCPRKIDQFDKAGRFVKTHFSAATAAREMKCAPAHIYAVANGRRKWCQGSTWKYSEIQHLDEEFKEHPDIPKLWSSNYGRIRHTNGAITVGTLRPDGYYDVKHQDTKYLVHRIVARTWHGSLIDKEVDHVDGNKGNNKPGNLQIVSHSDNVKRAYRFVPK